MPRSSGFLSKLSKPINGELKVLRKKRDQLSKEIDHLEGFLKEFFGATGKTKRSPKSRKKKRIRRSPEQLKKLASKVVDFIKASKGGVMAGEIKRKFGVDFLPSPKAFLKKYGFAVKTKGSGKRPVYHA